MSVRFYMPASGSAAVSPAISAEWDHVNTDRRPLVLNKTDTALADTSYSPDVADHLADLDSHFVQFVSAELPAQTIAAQTIGLCARAFEIVATSNLFLSWKLYAVVSDGSSVIGTLVAHRRDNTELGTNIRTRYDAVTSTEVVCGSAFRLVLEVGMGGLPTASGAIDAHNGTMGFGDAILVGDLAAEDATAASVLCPWLQFETGLHFAAVGGGAGIARLTGGGLVHP